MSLKIKLLLGFIIHFAVHLTAQVEVEKTNNASSSLRLAQHFFSNNELEKAEAQLLHTLSLKADFAIAYRLLGRVYLEKRAFQSAVSAFENSFKLNQKLSRAAWFECGEAYLQLLKPGKALQCFQQYERAANQSYANKKKEEALETYYNQFLEKKIKNCQLLSTVDTLSLSSTVRPYSEEINSKLDEYMPSFINNGKKMIFTRMDQNGYEYIYQSEKKETGWSTPKRISPLLMESFNEGMGRFTYDGRTIYFAGSAFEQSLTGCSLYKVSAAEKSGKSKIIQPVLNNHSAETWDSQPSLSCDGKMLFFSSNRPGGFGGTDIWYCLLRTDGSWGEPINAGRSINTSDDEESPYIAADGNTLYFSSTGREGFGDADFFMSRFENGNWTNPKNLGFPINSSSKELGLQIVDDEKTIIFSSARPGNNAGSMDIYEAQLPEGMRPKPVIGIHGIIIDKAQNTPVSTNIDIIGSEFKKTIPVDSSGSFYICLSGNQSYTFIIEETGYHNLMQAVYFPANKDQQDLVLYIDAVGQESRSSQKIAETERRIPFFFDFDSYAISAETKDELIELASLIKKEGKWTVEIIGYSDPTGNAAYNFQLSQKRAQIIANFLENVGINTSSIIKIEGLGSNIVIDNQAEKGRRVDIILKQ